MLDKIEKSKTFNIIFFIAIFALCLALCVKNSSVDFDFWSRLIMGSHVVHTGKPMLVDVVSYTPTHYWYDHEWLSSALYYLIITKFSGTGIVVLKSVTVFITILLIHLIISYRAGSFSYKYKYFYILLIISILTIFNFFDRARCQDFTYVFYLTYILILEHQRKNTSSKIIYLTPLLMLLWLNCHGASVFGLCMLVIYAIGEFLNAKPFKHYLFALVPNLLVYFINPWGVEFVKFMVFATSSVDRSYIGEWQSPFHLRNEFKNQSVIAFILIFALYFYNLIKNKINFKTIDYTKLFMLIFAFIPALLYIKFRTTLLITVFVFMYEDIKKFLDDCLLKIKFKFPLGVVSFAIYIITSIYLFLNFSITNNWYLNASRELPLKCMQFLCDNNIKGNVFAPFNFGGFIAYKHAPDFKIFLDGRQEQVYDYEISVKHMDLLNLEYFEAPEIFNEHPTDIIIMQDFWRFNQFLDNQNYFKKVYQEGTFSVYLAPAAQKFSYTYPVSAVDYTIDKFFKSKSF
ncbi:MAG: hypothetical protein IJ877_03460 [Candidatus Gastranaerophilales bacterium]|nr:hypothetical protein [Candidatus Gastranaerophilales bacterium]